LTGDTSFKFPGTLDAAVRAEADAWRAGDKMRRLWARDASRWTGARQAVAGLGPPPAEARL
jgi:transaldolase / glucose-6-phosphate isomerase